MPDYLLTGDGPEKVSPLRPRSHWPRFPARRLTYLDPSATFSVSLVCMCEDGAGNEFLTCTHSGGAVTDVPIMPRERSCIDVNYNVLGTKANRERLITQVADHIAVTRRSDWTLPVGYEVLTLIDALAREASTRRQPPAGR